MRSLFVALTAMIMITSCSRNKEVKTPESETTHKCFAHFDAKDTIKISLTISEKSVTGELTYILYEKDRNYGMINGNFSGDTLLAEYEFQSEGMTSVRDVSFLKKGNALVDLSGLELKAVECDANF